MRVLCVCLPLLCVDFRSLRIDIEAMHGATVDAMAAAVESAAVVVICLSPAYKESANCRLEAQYALQLKKPIVPLMMVDSYQPDGWLGLILGSMLWFDVSRELGSEEFGAGCAGLLRELEHQGVVTAGGAGGAGVVGGGASPAQAGDFHDDHRGELLAATRHGVGATMAATPPPSSPRTPSAGRQSTVARAGAGAAGGAAGGGGGGPLLVLGDGANFSGTFISGEGGNFTGAQVLSGARKRGAGGDDDGEDAEVVAALAAMNVEQVSMQLGAGLRLSGKACVTLRKLCAQVHKDPCTYCAIPSVNPCCSSLSNLLGPASV